MVVEDNGRMRAKIREIVVEEVQNVEAVFECENGVEAVEEYEKHLPDWVLMDISMEGMNGLTASAKILQRHPDAKIMIVTQYDDPEYRDAARMIGIYAYVLKDTLTDIPALLKSILKH